MAGNDKRINTNPGGWIGLAVIGSIMWCFVGWWALIPIGIVAFISIAMPGVEQALYDDKIRKKNARKMRRELRMEQRMGLAAEYIRRHPDKG